MVDRAELCVICYDISDTKARARVADILESRAARVQGSVFEARLSRHAARALMAELRPHLLAGDSLRLYRVGDRQLDHCDNYGGPAIGAGARYWLL
ncbi:MAG: CRISPR-associated endonuclease Cas2 [Alphaproteobacteria bacterium]|nr:MAG: CRISPR-associated endonuclease Cas2 [Alphaproteobacteria bacterium]